jgi:hypothetical protein
MVVPSYSFKVPDEDVFDTCSEARNFGGLVALDLVGQTRWIIFIMKPTSHLSGA